MTLQLIPTNDLIYFRQKGTIMIIDYKGNTVLSEHISIEKSQFFSYSPNKDQSSKSYRKIFINKDKATGNTSTDIRTLFIFKENEERYTIRHRSIFIQKINGKRVKDEQSATIAVPCSLQSKIHRIVSLFLASKE